MRIVTLVVVIWLVIGAVAAGQRGYFTHAAQNCASAGTTAVTVIAGPLNYFGVNPKVSDCNMPKPSSSPLNSFNRLKEPTWLPAQSF